MGYRYETHLHTCEGSACASASGAEMARVHKELGYTGIFVTDHFFNGNTAVPRELPWRERVRLFCLGYERARDEGEKIGLDVFFGFEFARAGDLSFTPIRSGRGTILTILSCFPGMWTGWRL